MSYERVLRVMPAPLLNEITTVEDINFVYEVTTSDGLTVLPNVLISFYAQVNGTVYLLHTGMTNQSGLASHMYRLMDFAPGVQATEYTAYATLLGCYSSEYSDTTNECAEQTVDQSQSLPLVVHLQSDAPQTCIDGEVMQEVQCSDGNVIYQKVCVGGYWKDSGLKCPESSNPFDNSGILPIALAIAVGIAAWAAYATKR